MHDLNYYSGMEVGMFAQNTRSTLAFPIASMSMYVNKANILAYNFPFVCTFFFFPSYDYYTIQGEFI